MLTIVLQTQFGKLTLEDRLYKTLETNIVFKPVHILSQAIAKVASTSFEAISLAFKKEISQSETGQEIQAKVKKFEKEVERSVQSFLKETKKPQEKIKKNSKSKNLQK